MTPATSPIALEDIAKNVGVAVSTVSRALRNLPGIHPQTREMVTREAESLGYVARRRKNGDTNAHHILILTAGEETPSAYLAGLSRASVQLNIALHFHYAARAACEDLLAPGHLPPSLREELISGIVLVYRWPEKVVAELSKKLPAVSIVHTYPDLPVDVVGIDHAGGMFSLVRHLKATGHERIGFLGLDPRISWSRSRFAAYLEALLALELPATMDHVVRLDLDHSLEEEVPKVIDRILGEIEDGVRGWICADDFIGYALCEELLRRRTRIPEDVAVTGFHRHPQIRHGNLPLLTSTNVDSELVGFSALQRLVRRMDHPDAAPHLELVPATFFQGQMTVAPKQARWKSPLRRAGSHL